jgi:hypothetical protein
MLVFLGDEARNRAEAALGPWDCVSCPAAAIHGLQNVGLEPASMQAMLGKAKPDLMRYADPALQQKRDAPGNAPVAGLAGLAPRRAP